MRQAILLGVILAVLVCLVLAQESTNGSPSSATQAASSTTDQSHQPQTQTQQQHREHKQQAAAKTEKEKEEYFIAQCVKAAHTTESSLNLIRRLLKLKVPYRGYSPFAKAIYAHYKFHKIQQRCECRHSKQCMQAFVAGSNNKREICFNRKQCATHCRTVLKCDKPKIDPAQGASRRKIVVTQASISCKPVRECDAPTQLSKRTLALTRKILTNDKGDKALKLRRKCRFRLRIGGTKICTYSSKECSVAKRSNLLQKCRFIERRKKKIPEIFVPQKKKCGLRNATKGMQQEIDNDQDEDESDATMKEIEETERFKKRLREQAQKAAQQQQKQRGDTPQYHFDDDNDMQHVERDDYYDNEAYNQRPPARRQGRPQQRRQERPKPAPKQSRKAAEKPKQQTQQAKKEVKPVKAKEEQVKPQEAAKTASPVPKETAKPAAPTVAPKTNHLDSKISADDDLLI